MKDLLLFCFEDSWSDTVVGCVIEDNKKNCKSSVLKEKKRVEEEEYCI